GDAPESPATARAPAEPRKPEPAPALPDGATARMGTSQFRHGESVFFIAYTPDGQQLLTAGKDRTIRLWDAATGREVRRFERTTEKYPAPALTTPAMPVAPGMMVRRGPEALGEF